uniref:Uncharacterized protein n=1 Tax=Rhizophora mucronata TaxID=61149 RepID=A0A2P2Q849_RHIMU
MKRADLHCFETKEDLPYYKVLSVVDTQKFLCGHPCFLVKIFYDLLNFFFIFSEKAQELHYWLAHLSFFDDLYSK